MTEGVRVVHVVAKTHLDLGFTGLVKEVAARYVTDFVPRAIATAAELRRRAPGDGPRLVWTTGSWILRHVLISGTEEQQAAATSAVEQGDLAWHALPFTTHTELADAELFRAGLAVSRELDERFGRTTTGAKMSDVPGHTRAMVPLLAEAGVTFLHLGVNPAWPLPDVPSIFRWRSPDGAEIVVAYERAYGREVVVAGCDEALAFLHAGDNLGPPSADDVKAFHVEMSARFPGAEVRASTLDGFARALAASGSSERLPVVTAEIGDPWLFGAGSDPHKVAGLRQALRHRTDRTADDALLRTVEHTWGLDEKVALGTESGWDRPGLELIRASDEGRRYEASWAEQRSTVTEALDRLGIEPLDVPRWPMGDDGVPLGGFVPLAPGAEVGGAGWELAVDPDTGGLEHLVRIDGRRRLADADHQLGAVTYQSYDETDYEGFWAGLDPSPEDEWWARLDNTKPGADAGGARSGTWAPRVTGSWHATQGHGGWQTVLVRSRFPSEAVDTLGAPAELWSRWAWSDDAAEIDLDLWWHEKAASRLPESLWCSFVPTVAEPDQWQLDKMGQAVSPLDVVARGGRALHGVGDGMAYAGPDGPLCIHTADAPLVSPGRLGLLDADPPIPDLARGFAVLLGDNCWGTNFPMWIEGPARFRFTISV